MWPNQQWKLARKLNRVLRWIQRTPKKLTYLPYSGQQAHLRVISDAAFKKENDEGRAMRGVLFLKAPGASYQGTHALLLLIWLIGLASLRAMLPEARSPRSCFLMAMP